MYTRTLESEMKTTFNTQIGAEAYLISNGFIFDDTRFSSAHGASWVSITGTAILIARMFDWKIAYFSK